jgi:microcin C transport system permease protein
MFQMLSYVLKRLLLMIPTLFGIMLLTFVVTQFVPGGPVEQLINQLEGKSQNNESATSYGSSYRGHSGLDEEILAKIKQRYGFDKPVYIRFWLMIKNYVTFDFGTSYFEHKSVLSLILEKLPVSISLGVWTFLITYLVSIPLGISKALYHGSRFDLLSSTIILIGYAIPGFLLGIALLVLFGGGSFYDVFPLRGLVSDNFSSLLWYEKILDYLWHIFLPIVAMSVGSLAVMTQLTKNSFLEEIKKQYVITARAKGLKDKKIFYRHILRNAMIPLITGFPAAFIGAFFTGSLLIEQIFSLDGLGLLSYESILRRDYPVVLGSLFIFSLMGLVAKLLTDISYVLIDPRIAFDKTR